MSCPRALDIGSSFRILSARPRVIRAAHKTHPRAYPVSGTHDAELLDRVQQLLSNGDLIWTKHAREQMGFRNAARNDVRQAIRCATSAVFQEEEGTVRLRGGKDLDGDKLTIAVSLEDRGCLRIVTVIGDD